MVVIVSCPSCGKKIPAYVGENNKCRYCGHQFYLEKKIDYSKERYEELKEDYFWLYEVKKFIREHKNLPKEKIYDELKYVPKHIIDRAIDELKGEGVLKEDSADIMEGGV